MSNILDVIKGLNQAAANGGDYGGEYGEDQKIGLKREEGDPIRDKRVIDGFRVRFAGPKMIITYESEMRLEELHPREKFEDEIERIFGDIVKFLKKEYKNITKGTVKLEADSPAEIIVQTTSRQHTWVQAHKQYYVGGFDGVESLGMTSERDIERRDKPYEEKFKKFLELSTDKKPENVSAKANPETPEG